MNSTKSVFENKPSNEDINLMLFVLAERKIDPGHFIKYHKKTYKLTDDRGNIKYFNKGTEVIVAKTLDNHLYANVNSKTYLLEELKEHEKESRYFNPGKTKENVDKKYIPPMDHPWRRFKIKKFSERIKNKVA